MAFDKKRLRTFDWLQSLADYKAQYLKGYGYIHSILAFSGNIYATNDIILAKVNYPEFEHLSDDEWSSIIRYKDDEGLLLASPVLEEHDRQYTDRRFLEDLFIKELAIFKAKIDYRVLKDALKPFEINGIKPNLATDSFRIELSGHNKDISIKIVMMGMG